MPIEINEIGPTIQQGVIQRPVQRDMQAAGARPRRSMPPMNTQQTARIEVSEKETGCWNRKVNRIIMITYLTVYMKTDHLH